MSDSDPDLAVANRPFTRYYSSRLRVESKVGAGLESLDARLEVAVPDSRAIRDRVNESHGQLNDLIWNELSPDDPPRARLLETVANQLMQRGARALDALRRRDEEALVANPALLEGLEGIVRTDGSRPSFLIRNGKVDETTSPIGEWGPGLAVSENNLKRAIACVGRINTPNKQQKWQGTGFLVGPNVILTNRHVLQSVATRENDGTWLFSPEAHIDFGHEFRAQASVNPRKLKRVVFAGSRAIDTSPGVPIDHTKLDLALIEIEPGENPPPVPLLAVDGASDWPQPDMTRVYIIGYPGSPLDDMRFDLLEMLFQSTFGHKRLAPGVIMDAPFPMFDWSRAHDATTLGGNSGSVVLVAGREVIAAGLHYGGRTAAPLGNFTHVLGSVFRETDGRSAPSLAERLEESGVRLVNREVE